MAVSFRERAPISPRYRSAELFKHTLEFVPKEIHYAEELIGFSKEAKRVKRPLIDPRKKEEVKED